MQYVSNTQHDSISHWGFGKQSEKHKYYQRIVVGKNSDGSHKYRYFYDHASYQAYLDKQTSDKSKKIQESHLKTQSNIADRAAQRNMSILNDKGSSSKLKKTLTDKSKELYDSEKADNDASRDKKLSRLRDNIDAAEKKRTALAEKQDKSNTKVAKLSRKARRALTKATGINVSKIKSDIKDSGKNFVQSVKNAVKYEYHEERVYSTTAGKYTKDTITYRKKRFGSKNQKAVEVGRTRTVYNG